ncbi:MAG: hypothetical protein AB1898_08825 [Acidobacteriota bacterium]
MKQSTVLRIGEALLLVLMAGMVRPSSLPAQDQPLPAANSMSEDEARQLIKGVPTVNIPATLSRWKFSEAELATLRKWSAALVTEAGRPGFLKQWTETIQQVRRRNPQLASADIANLIQMLMGAAYEEASKLATSSGSDGAQLKPLQELKQRLDQNLADAKRLRVLMGTPSSDPLAGSVISLPAPQRTLHRCHLDQSPDPKVSCHQVLVSTTTELSDYLSTTETQLQEVENQIQVAGKSPQPGDDKRVQRLIELSSMARMMHSEAVGVAARSNR